MPQSQDMANVARRRFYGREWKRNKPHLPKSTSLPIFKLLPIDRPIFTCRQCGFLNTLIPLCLWCCWTSDAALREFEQSMPRTRRVSAPSRVFWKRATFELASPCGSDYVSTTTIPWSLEEHKSNLLVDDMPTIQHTLIRDRDAHHQRPPNPEFVPDQLTYCRDAHRPPSEATAGETPNVTNATPVGLAPKLRRPSWSNERARKSKGGAVGITPRRQPSVHLPPLRHSVSTGVDRRTPMHLIRTVSTKSLRSTHIVIDFKALHESYDLKLKSDELSTKSAPTQRTLRRKKRVSLFRTSSTTPPSPPSRPQSASTTESATDAHSEFPPRNAYIESHVPVPLHEPNKSTLTHSRSRSQPINTVRLGHPSRPYYTAIRPNMATSRPTSPTPTPRSQSPSKPPPTSFPRPTRPTSLPAPARAPSPGILSVLSSTSALSDEEDSPLDSAAFASAYRPRSSSTNDRPRPLAFGSLSRHRGGGFSLSGETELRMALAREHEADGKGEVFRFRDMGKKHRGARVMRKVKELKKGLKGLVMGRAGREERLM